MSIAYNDRIALFISEYLKNGNNGKQAAIKAGYSKRSAESTASRLLRIEKVRKSIDARKTKAFNLAEVTLERLIHNLIRIAEADPRRLYKENGELKNITEVDDDTAMAISSVDSDEIMEWNAAEKVMEKTGQSKKVKLAEKVPALALLGKMMGHIIDRKQITGPDGQPLIPPAAPLVDAKKFTDEQLLQLIEVTQKMTVDAPKPSDPAPNP